MNRHGAVVALAAVAAVAGGCGGSGSSSSAKQECVLRAKLGTRRDVEAALAPRPSFFDERGRIIPYDDQDPQQQLAFDRWANTRRVHDVTGPAQDAALARLKPDC